MIYKRRTKHTECKCTEATPVERKVVEGLYKKIGNYKLPDEFIEFMMVNNDGRSINDYVTINRALFEISFFLSFDEDDPDYCIYEALDDFLSVSDGKPLPLAVSASDDHYCLGLKDNGVYFREHEYDEDEFELITDDIKEFLNLF